MDVSVQHSESTEAAQQTVTEEAQLYSSHIQHLSFRISVTATFPRRQIILLNALSPCEYFLGHGGLLLMNGLPAQVFHLHAAKACVWRDNQCRLSRRGEKYLCIFLTSRLFIPTNLLFVSKCVRSHPGRLNQCDRIVLIFVNHVIKLVMCQTFLVSKGHIYFICDIDRQAMGLSRAWHCCRDGLRS